MGSFGQFPPFPTTPALCHHNHHANNANIWTFLTPNVGTSYVDTLSPEDEDDDERLYAQPYTFSSTLGNMSNSAGILSNTSTPTTSEHMMPMLVNLSQDNKILPARFSAPTNSNHLYYYNHHSNHTQDSNKTAPSANTPVSDSHMINPPNKRIKRNLQEVLPSTEEWESYVPPASEIFTLYNQNHQEITGVFDFNVYKNDKLALAPNNSATENENVWILYRQNQFMVSVVLTGVLANYSSVPSSMQLFLDNHDTLVEVEGIYFSLHAIKTTSDGLLDGKEERVTLHQAGASRTKKEAKNVEPVPFISGTRHTRRLASTHLHSQEDHHSQNYSLLLLQLTMQGFQMEQQIPISNTSK
jgi:hypothetical protein